MLLLTYDYKLKLHSFPDVKNPLKPQTHQHSITEKVRLAVIIVLELSFLWLVHEGVGTQNLNPQLCLHHSESRQLESVRPLVGCCRWSWYSYLLYVSFSWLTLLVVGACCVTNKGSSA